MDVQHSIEIIANVDGVRVHRVLMDLNATGEPADAMSGFDPAMSVVLAMRQEADLIEQGVKREAWLRARAGNWVDADPDRPEIEAR